MLEKFELKTNFQYCKLEISSSLQVERNGFTLVTFVVTCYLQKAGHILEAKVDYAADEKGKPFPYGCDGELLKVSCTNSSLVPNLRSYFADL